MSPVVSGLFCQSIQIQNELSMSPALPPSAAESSRRKPASVWKRLLLLAGTICLLAGLLETGTRLLTDTIPPLLVKDPKIGKRYQKSFDMTVHEAEAQRDIHMRFNRVGFRGPDRPFDKPDHVRRVAVLGDSMIASLAVDEEDTLVARLQTMLNASHSEMAWETMNFGVSGSSPAQQLALYREVVRRFKPDIVLCNFFVGNDLADNCHRLSHHPRIYFDIDENNQLRQLPFSESSAYLSQWLNRYSRFYVWQKGATRRVISTARTQLQMMPPGGWIFCSREAPADVQYAWRLTELLAVQLREEVQRDGAVFGLVILPSSDQIYKDRFEALASIDPQHQASFDWDYPDRRLAEICERNEIRWHTMTDEFRAAAPSQSSKVDSEWLFHAGIGHLNEAGNLLAARSVYRFLTDKPEPHVAEARSMLNLVR